MPTQNQTNAETYLIPCECGAAISATATQSGVALSCPGCGRPTVVPPLSGLRQFPVREPAQPGLANHDFFRPDVHPSRALGVGLWLTWLTGTGLNTMLAWHAFQPVVGLPGCSGGMFDCDAVLSSHYGRVLGLSVTVPAFAFYLAVAGLLILVRHVPAPFTLVLPVVAGMGVSAGGWALWVMLVQIKGVCPWCLGLHASNVLLFFLSLVYAWQDWRIGQKARQDVKLPPLPARLPAVAGIFAVILALFPALFFSLFHDQPKLRLTPIAEELFEEMKFDEAVGIVTSKGDSRISNTLVVYSCFTCPGCRKLNVLLSTLLFEYAGQLRVDQRFRPQNAACNSQMAADSAAQDNEMACDLAYAALAVAKLAPDRYGSFADWLFANQADMTLRWALSEARRRVDPHALDQALASTEVRARLERDDTLAKRVGLISVPQLYLQSGHVEGDMSVGAIRDFIEREFRLTAGGLD